MYIIMYAYIYVKLQTHNQPRNKATTVHSSVATMMRCHLKKFNKKMESVPCEECYSMQAVYVFLLVDGSILVDGRKQ